MKQLMNILFWFSLITLCSITIKYTMFPTNRIEATIQEEIKQKSDTVNIEKNYDFKHPVYRGEPYEIIHPIYKGEPYEIKLLNK